MKEDLLRKAMKTIGARGGKRNTKAQSEARRKNAAKARKAKAAKGVRQTGVESSEV
jgi:hypothetical protein